MSQYSDSHDSNVSGLLWVGGWNEVEMLAIGIMLKLAIVGYGSTALAQQPVVEVVLHYGSDATGNGALLASAPYSSVVVQLIGPFGGTVEWQTSNDEENWNDVACTNRSSKVEATTATVVGTYVCPGGASLFRASFTRTSGTLTAIANGTVAVTASASGGGGGSFDGIIKDGAGDTTQANVSSGRLQVENINPNLANDNSTNSTAKVPVLGCVATAAASSWTEGRQVPCRTDLEGSLVVRHPDPCSALPKQYFPFIITTATTTEITPLFSGPSKYYYVCSVSIGPVSGAQNIAMTDDNTDNCASVDSGLAGGTTAANGWNIAANGSVVIGNGAGSIAKTNGFQRVICMVTSAAVVTPGVITVVAAP